MDLCDRCGALGKAQVVLTDGKELVFCNHHLNEHQDKLIEIEALIISEDLERV